MPIDPALAPYVRLIWTLEVDHPAAFGAPERIVPDGIVEVVFHYGTPFDQRVGQGAFVRQPRTLVVSQTRRFIEIRPPGAGGFVSVRFHPWGACHFFGVPVRAFADSTVCASDLWGREALIVEERINTVRTAAERSRLVQTFLRRLLRRHHKGSVEGLVRTVGALSSNRRVHVRMVSREVGMSERTLERTFTSALGMPPKQFARLQRFLHTCHLLRHGTWATLAEVAQAAGYYDQPHCINEFQAFAGMTPRAFVASENVAFLDIE
jgi:AraC-like DNA-binding protein